MTQNAVALEFAAPHFRAEKDFVAAAVARPGGPLERRGVQRVSERNGRPLSTWRLEGCRLSPEFQKPEGVLIWCSQVPG